MANPSTFYTDIDLQKQKLLNFAADPVANDPGSPVEGQVWVNTTGGQLKVRIGGITYPVATQPELNNVIAGLAWKDNVLVATTGEITIATDLNSGDSIDGITLSNGDRVLVKDQTTNPEENGIYIVGVTPIRATDMDLSEEFNAAVITVTEGTVNSGLTYRCTTVDPIVDTDVINFIEFASTVPNATTTVAGKVELATQAEIEAKTDTSRAATAVSLATFVRNYESAISGTGGTITAATHGLVAPLEVEIKDNIPARVWVDIQYNSPSVNDITWATNIALPSGSAIYISGR